MIACFDAIVKDIYEIHFVEPETDAKTKSIKAERMGKILTEIKGLHEDDQTSVKNLGPQHIGRLVTTRAIVIRVS